MMKKTWTCLFALGLIWMAWAAVAAPQSGEQPEQPEAVEAAPAVPATKACQNEVDAEALTALPEVMELSTGGACPGGTMQNCESGCNFQHDLCEAQCGSDWRCVLGCENAQFECYQGCHHACFG